MPDRWKGILAGAVGGVGATAAMSAFQSLWKYVDHRVLPRTTNGTLSDEADWVDGDGQAPATVNAAERLASGLFGYELDERQKGFSASAIHFGFGTVVGAVYGALAEFSAEIARGDGVPFGTALMAVSDELGVPALGLSRPPQEKPMSSHLYGLCSHVVYGFVLETTRRAVRRALETHPERSF